MAHERRERFAGRFPQHVTMRVGAGVGTLRSWPCLDVLHAAIEVGGRRDDFRVVQFVMLSNHLHLIVEADGAEGLARGIQGLAVRLARRLNRTLGRAGSLFAERYHARSLRSPRQVRNALRYVLCNSRRHAAARGERLDRDWLDPFSSAPWFDGWRDPPRRRPARAHLPAAPPTAPPTVWLLTTGWRRGGPLAHDEAPGTRY